MESQRLLKGKLQKLKYFQLDQGPNLFVDQIWLPLTTGPFWHDELQSFTILIDGNNFQEKTIIARNYEFKMKQIQSHVVVGSWELGTSIVKDTSA